MPNFEETGLRIVGHESTYSGHADYSKNLDLDLPPRPYKNGGYEPSLHTINALLKNPHLMSEHETDLAGARLEYLATHPSLQNKLKAASGVSGAQIGRDATFDLNSLNGLAKAEHGYHFPLSDSSIPIVGEMQDQATLGSHDVVGTTFWIATNLMLAFTMFFFMEIGDVPMRWRRSVLVSGLVTGVAFWNYIYMRDTWVKTQQTPTVYRYCDWLITVPLLMVEFYLILGAVADISSSVFNRLFYGSIVMLLGGWAGEVGLIGCLPGFVIGMLGWFYIINEIYMGEAAQVSQKVTNSAVRMAYSTCRTIVGVGWIIYPLGYFICYLIAPGSPDAYAFGYQSQSVLSVIYNLADLINKGAYGMFIYAAAMSDRS